MSGNGDKRKSELLLEREKGLALLMANWNSVAMEVTEWSAARVIVSVGKQLASPGMSSAHAEREMDNGLEPTVGEQLRLAQFVNALDKASEDELRTIAKQMAQQVLVTFPSALRFLAREAARNLAGQPWSAESSEKLLDALTAPEKRHG